MKVGFVALVGRPNTGKSSLLNAIIGEKVSIVSAAPQTTRKTIRGIFTDSEMQAIFLDTPGLHEGGELLIEAINAQARKSLDQADVILRLIDASRTAWEEDARIDTLLSKVTKPVITIYTKSDLPKARKLPSDAIVVSDKDGEYDQLLAEIAHVLPEGPMLYDEDYYTDQDLYTRISEVIREQSFLLLEEEIPHALFVEVESLDETPKGLRVLAYVHVERDSQKKILIGKWGAKIQEISTASRLILTDILDRPIHLFLRAKVTPNWRKNAYIVDSLFPHA